MSLRVFADFAIQNQGRQNFPPAMYPESLLAGPGWVAEYIRGEGKRLANPQIA
jgi:hypothetical protein